MILKSMQTYPQILTYADLILQTGLNLQPGQRLLIASSTMRGVDIRLAPFVEVIVERAYQHGARHVDVIWSDPALERSWLQHASLESVGSYPAGMGAPCLSISRRGMRF